LTACVAPTTHGGFVLSKNKRKVGIEMLPTSALPNLNHSKGAMLLKKPNTIADNNGIKNNTFTKKIGKATYQVKIHFSPDSEDTFNDKLLRIVKADNTAKSHRKAVLS